MSTGIRTEM